MTYERDRYMRDQADYHAMLDMRTPRSSAASEYDVKGMLIEQLTAKVRELDGKRALIGDALRIEDLGSVPSWGFIIETIQVVMNNITPQHARIMGEDTITAELTKLRAEVRELETKLKALEK